MKTFTKILIAFLLFGSVMFTQAQSPYTHGIGATVGNMFGVSYKTFATDNFAISADLSVRLCPVGRFGLTGLVYSFDLNPNFMYESNITNDLYWFAGGGVTMGYCFAMGIPGFMEYDHSGLFGINAIGGIEYQFNAPVALQFDFRPGYGLIFGKDRYQKSIKYGITILTGELPPLYAIHSKVIQN